jgi:hypothetical protein
MSLSVFVAVAVLALLLVAGLVVDGGAQARRGRLLTRPLPRGWQGSVRW